MGPLPHPLLTCAQGSQLVPIYVALQAVLEDTPATFTQVTAIK